MKPKDIKPGDRFGRLVVQDIYERDCNGKLCKVAECVCDCGNSLIVLLTSLCRNDHPTQSCGCYRRQNTKTASVGDKLYLHPLRRVYDSMKARCYRKAHKSYHNYGGRGIEICPEWRDNYRAFYQWAIGAGWSKGLQLDRIDNSGDYSPSNCRFVSSLDNNMNKRDNILIEAFGEIKPLAQWERGRDPRSKVKLNALQHRLKMGWAPEDAITMPPRSNHDINHERFNYTAFGETKTAEGWDNDPRCQVAKTTLLRRIRLGWSIEDAILTPPNHTPDHK